ncbi:MAG TPA: Na+/H+ antiporter subunit E [Burkholderiaceae bacterium]|nr:Na+/H+ antiporter subunit E [Burkholderiaceae bacterium]HLU14964.1 Na+/H+ antiporter subunit E [Burkholderiaceae bacterium]
MRFAKWLFDWLMLIPLFLGELAKSVYDVLQNVINPERVGASAIVKVPLDVKSDLGIALVANMVTLTPGTTTLHVADDKSCFYAHVMNYSESVADDIKQGFERQIMKVLP